MPNQVDDTIGRFLVRYGEWAWLEAEFIAGVFGAGARVLDGGAFLGTFGLGVAMAGRPGYLCFVEANPEIEKPLAANVEKNSKIPYHVVGAMIAGSGVAPRIGHVDPDNMGSMSYREDADVGEPAPPASRSVTLRELRAEHGPFNLVKLDLEGMELQALDGDAEHLSKGETALWIECNEHRRSLDVARRLLAWGLDVYYFAFPSFNPGNVNADPEPIYSFAYEAGLLAAPRGKPELSPELQAKGCILKRVRSVYELKQAMWRTPRWGPAEWRDAAGPELVALAGRTLRGEQFDLFLGFAPVAVMPAEEATDTEKDRLRLLLKQEREVREAAESGLEQARSLALTRGDEVGRERASREKAESGLEQARELAMARADDLAKAETRLATVEEVLAAQAEELQSSAAHRQRLDHELLVLRDQIQDAGGRAEEATQHLAASEAKLASTSSRALSHLAALGEARDRMRILECGLDGDRNRFVVASAEAGAESLRLQQQIMSLDSELRQLRQSSLWRLTAPVRAFFGKRPRLRAALRRSVRAMSFRRFRR